MGIYGSKDPAPTVNRDELTRERVELDAEWDALDEERERLERDQVILDGLRQELYEEKKILDNSKKELAKGRLKLVQETIKFEESKTPTKSVKLGDFSSISFNDEPKAQPITTYPIHHRTIVYKQKGDVFEVSGNTKPVRERIREITGRKWNKERLIWTVPATIANEKQLKTIQASQ
jgi:hypothetical protein